MDRRPIVVVLMSTYNGSRYIREQIESILFQSDCEVKLFIRDDGSSDNTRDILREYADKKQLEWYAGENLKPAASFFDLIKISPSADYYAFSDQDDVWDIDKIITGVRLLEKSEVPSLYYCNARLVNSENESLNSLAFNNGIFAPINLLTTLCSGGAMGCTMVMNAALINVVRDAGMPKKVIMHDYYIQSLCKALNGNLIVDSNPHMSYRQHQNNVVGRKNGVLNALKYRIKLLTKKNSISMADQALDILYNFKLHIPDDNIEVLYKVAKYNKSLRNRIELSMSKDLHFRSVHDEIFMRLSILMAKR